MKPGDVILIAAVLTSVLILESKAMPADEAKRESPPTVITPGGPKPRDQVHTVEPGTHVEVNPDGTYSIVPDLNTDERPDPGSKAPDRH